MNDFDEIMVKVKNNTSPQKQFDINKWKEQKLKERQEVYDLIDKSAEEIKSNYGKFVSYLNVQGIFDKYSVGNALLINSQMPTATQLKDFNDWKEIGTSIKKNEVGIKILEPGDTYMRADGSSATSYNVKRLFDITQTTMNEQNKKTNNYDEKIILTALLKDCNVNPKFLKIYQENL